MNKKEKFKHSSRHLAVEILEKIETEDAYSNLLLRQVLNESQLIKEEANLLTELVYGVLQRKLTLDYQLQPFIKKPKKLDNWVLQLLRISLYQMEYLDRIPDHAIVNEAVNIARFRGHKGTSGLVNAILRNIQRKGVRDVTAIKNPSDRLSIQYSLPKWLVDEFIDLFGLEEAEQLAASFLIRPKLSVRVNTNQLSRAEAIEVLQSEGFESEASEISPYGIIVLKGNPTESRLYKEGLIAVQDESSMLVAPALNVAPDHHVLDACAAPGGKSMHIATTFLEGDKDGKIVALDIHEHKIKLINENAKRLGVSDKVEAIQLDARAAAEKFGEAAFDRVLVDAPCSGLGLMRRRPEIRYNKTKKDILSLQKLQKSILDETSKTLKPGGELVYSTCTITKAENQEVVQDFLNKHPEFVQIPVKLPNEKLSLQADGTITIYPHQYGTDGFFISAFKKVENAH